LWPTSRCLRSRDLHRRSRIGWATGSTADPGSSFEQCPSSLLSEIVVCKGYANAMLSRCPCALMLNVMAEVPQHGSVVNAARLLSRACALKRERTTARTMLNADEVSSCSAIFSAGAVVFTSVVMVQDGTAVNCRQRSCWWQCNSPTTAPVTSVSFDKDALRVVLLN
jgi:hypothetical protein